MQLIFLPNTYDESGKNENYGRNSHRTRFAIWVPNDIFGTLVIAGSVGFFLNRRWSGLPKIGEKYYDIIVLTLGLWCLGGLLIDSFAHISGTVDDTFFTPWHAVWYSGATAYGAYIFYALLPEEGMSHLVRHPF